jgi:hypothetical protein
MQKDHIVNNNAYRIFTMIATTTFGKNLAESLCVQDKYLKVDRLTAMDILIPACLRARDM